MPPAEQVWSVKAALDWTATFLAEKADEHPRRSAEWLLSAATGLSRVEIYAFHDRPLSDAERTSLRESVRRRAAGEPLQYVTGEVAFRHLVLKVRPGVLIPRPETEVLVDTVLPETARILAERGEVVVLDLCTGSGCIALSIASECPGATVFATDISALAIEIAAENTARLGLSDAVTTLTGDLFSALPPEARQALDVVISNPPYVPSADVPQLPAEVAGFEPRLALDGGPDGLEVFRRILAGGREWLRPGGLIAIELDQRMVQKAAAEAVEWYEDVRVVSDLAGRDRIISARLPERL